MKFTIEIVNSRVEGYSSFYYLKFPMDDLIYAVIKYIIEKDIKFEIKKVFNKYHGDEEKCVLIWGLCENEEAYNELVSYFQHFKKSMFINREWNKEKIILPVKD
jgi:hypothetical protein